jgi:hypothetical protein
MPFLSHFNKKLSLSFIKIYYKVHYILIKTMLNLKIEAAEMANWDLTKEKILGLGKQKEKQHNSQWHQLLFLEPECYGYHAST